jgi:hypothetical protein
MGSANYSIRIQSHYKAPYKFSKLSYSREKIFLVRLCTIVEKEDESLVDQYISLFIGMMFLLGYGSGGYVFQEIDGSFNEDMAVWSGMASAFIVLFAMCAMVLAGLL